jgi:hypothetical protein
MDQLIPFAYSLISSLTNERLDMARFPRSDISNLIINRFRAVVRSTAGYLIALKNTMKEIYGVNPGNSNEFDSDTSNWLKYCNCHSVIEILRIVSPIGPITHHRI